MTTLSPLPGSAGLSGKHQISPDAPEPHRSYRPVIASFGLACVVVAELLRPSSSQGLFAAIGFFALLVAAILMLVPKRDRRPAIALEVSEVEPRYPAATWRWTLAGLGLFSVVVAQTWFRSGTAIAWGDITPPIGTAWIGRIFNTYGWSGSNLGGPRANQGQLPFGVVDELVHLAGGSGALAQRIWLSLLIAGVIVAGAGHHDRSVATTVGIRPWYYGNDGFIPNLLDRHVVVPSGQGYDKVSSELLGAVQLEASALTSHNWTEASRVLTAIGTPILLVRGDIEATFPGRDIVSPAALSAALTNDPDMHLVHRIGPLSLYELNSQYRLAPTDYATTDSSAPDLNLLAVLPQRTALISSPPQAGHAVIVPLPPLPNWQVEQNGLTSRVDLPNGWTFTPAALTGATGVSGAPIHIAAISRPSASHQAAILFRTFGSSLISNGTFQSGGWGNVGNCNNAVPLNAPEAIGGGVVAVQGLRMTATNVLQLHASADVACESTPLDWHGGNFFIRYSSRSLSGQPPRLCVFEMPIGRCAQLSSTSTAPTSQGSAWVTHSSIVIPDIGTQTISVFVYADSPSGGGQTITQYANFVVHSIPANSDAVLIGSPETTAQPLHLTVGIDGYSPSWSSAPGTTHVIVDGLRNGWLTRSSTRNHPAPRYLATLYDFRDEVLLTSAMVLAASALWWRQRKRRYPEIVDGRKDRA